MTIQINWLGYTWNVKTDYWGPGPNYFSDSINNVWIDDQNRLHLKITNIGGKWYCAEIYMATPVGPGTYTINMVTNPENPALDNYAVVGIFYYLDDNNELDIEYARWDNPANNNLGNFTVQPAIASSQFYIDISNTVNKMVWYNNGNVDFEVVDSLGNIIKSFQYTGIKQTNSGGSFHLNLWLRLGNPPSDGLEKELILSNFLYVPEGVICSIKVTTPLVGVTYKKGDHRITRWISTGNVGTNVKIQLLRSGTVVKTISTGTANDGSFSWTVPSVSRSSDYQIKITSKTNSSCIGVSGKFTIR